MTTKGKSIIEAIKYLDAFYKDLGLMFSNFEALLLEKGFINLPTAKNTSTYFPFNITNHIGMSNKWTMKNIQRMYLKEDEIDSENSLINRAILCSLVLYPSSVFNIPVFICGILKWNVGYGQEELFSNWPGKKIGELVNSESSWRLKDGNYTERNKLIYNFIHVNRPNDKKIKIDEYSLFFVDLIKVENAKFLQEIVDTLAEMYDGREDINLNPNLTVDEIPGKLTANWAKNT